MNLKPTFLADEAGNYAYPVETVAQWPKHNGHRMTKPLYELTWRPIDTAPREEDVLVGRWSNDRWIWCQSCLCYERGNPMEGEPGGYWYWTTDDDTNGASEDPEAWMPLPPDPPGRFERSWQTPREPEVSNVGGLK